MDLCAEMLVKHAPFGERLQVSLPHFHKIIGCLPVKMARNFDRWYNRWVVYPRHLKSIAETNSFFHLVDHSYSHLLHYLPTGRVGVYCHDIDAFRSVLEPDKDPRPSWYKAMMGKVFEGFKKARIVFCNSEKTKAEIQQIGNWDDSSIILAPLGVADEFNPCGKKEDGNYLLHVGSCIPRKRIDSLLSIFFNVLKHFPDLKLIQAGGSFTNQHLNQIQSLGLKGKVEQRAGLTRDQLAMLYRGAKCLLITSDAEGFGLPVVEALSCGCRVVCSDIPVLREVAYPFARFCKIEDFSDWTNAVTEIVSSTDLKQQETGKIDFLQKYSWRQHSHTVFDTYKKIESAA